MTFFIIFWQRSSAHWNYINVNFTIWVQDKFEVNTVRCLFITWFIRVLVLLSLTFYFVDIEFEISLFFLVISTTWTHFDRFVRRWTTFFYKRKLSAIMVLKQNTLHPKLIESMEYFSARNNIRPKQQTAQNIATNSEKRFLLWFSE